jgi:hypothetical protein
MLPAGNSPISITGRGKVRDKLDNETLHICISMFKMQTNKNAFFKNREQEGKTGPVWALLPVGAK